MPTSAAGAPQETPRHELRGLIADRLQSALVATDHALTSHQVMALADAVLDAFGTVTEDFDWTDIGTYGDPDRKLWHRRLVVRTRPQAIEWQPVASSSGTS